MWSVVLLFVKQIQIICSGNCQDIVRWVPHCMQNFARVVQVVDADLVASSTVGLIGDNLVVQDLSELGHVPRRLVAVLVLVDSIKYSEKVVVRTCDDIPVNKPLRKTNLVRTNMSDHKICPDKKVRSYCQPYILAYHNFTCVKGYESVPFQPHSNLSKMLSFS